ncbi:Subtilase family protein [Lutibacter oricola]|uniref:Subtilase family protein n=1 Tax=Lutibacter oricola TaxID=762486 RepID=A0A1H2R300_9FLAO|nr:S8 family peptidase [Lutibacter oricola]SDW13767.1 Subtilase family protein [Lutibacter oricola]
MRILKSVSVAVLATATLASCSSLKNMAVPAMDTSVALKSAKTVELSDKDFNHWAHRDLVSDTVPGMSLAKAYKFIEGKESTQVIVGVIDSGIDIEHEDLKNVLWTNPKEIAGNNIDDDKNGYVDDVYGWNFLGGDSVDAPEQLEITRLYAKAKKRFEGKTLETVSADEKADFEMFKKYEKGYEASSKRFFGTMTRLKQIEENYTAVKKFLGKDKIELKDLQAVKTGDKKLQAQIGDVLSMFNRGLTEDAFNEYYDSQKKNKNYSLDFDGRAIVGDNPNDINDVVYGNGNVIGSKDVESHGTHVSGIILAERGNGIGLDGVANNAVLMSVRAVPDGDERDKDVALAIRYAVDNGAKVINMSFGKSWSPNPEWVFDAFKYAEKHDVLLVHAAGNDHKDIDVKENWPNDTNDKINELCDNVLTIGAMSSSYNENIPATFSNYGARNVDIFAPGVQIYSTVPKNEYARYNGTSMASPEAAGVATLIRSYYPELSASQVKHIIMNSGTEIDMDVLLPGGDGKKVKFSSLSVSGKVVNAYNALVLADKMVNGK